MLYPENCQERLGFNEVKQLVHQHCLSIMGKALVDKMQVIQMTIIGKIFFIIIKTFLIS